MKTIYVIVEINGGTFTPKTELIAAVVQRLSLSVLYAIICADNYCNNKTQLNQLSR